MGTLETIDGYEARLEHFGLDARARSLMRETWSLIAPHLDRAINDMVLATQKLPRITPVVIRHENMIKKLEAAHFKALLGGELDQHYVVSCRRTVEQETAVGIDSRMRSSAGNFVLCATLKALQRKYPFSYHKAIERALVVSRVIALDVSNAIALHREFSEKASHARRKTIDAAISEFADAIEDVLAAIKETSRSLSSTSGALKEVADDALGRMAKASAAAANTAQRVGVVEGATGELSQSIAQIGQEASRGLDMARIAVDDTQRTHKAIRSLEEAAERIGSVVGLISTIASQTNLLALNATIEAARAGNAGRGFAVVASEVKALANQTSRATDDISAQIAAIQEATKHSVEEISSIARVIEQLSAVTGTIATAVEEQNATTHDIVESMQNAADGTARASDEISSIERAAGRTSEAVLEIAGWTERLYARARDLEVHVESFFAKVRAA
jgi:methyl-accepting chemotaxis protein